MRFGYLDLLRGTAVIWMMIFHFAYDLRMLGMTQWDFSSGFWYGFPRVIAFTFLFCVGLSIPIAHRQKIHWDSLWKRSFKIGIGALLISLGTWLMFPGQWIYFGTLHCIFVGSILGTLLVHQRKTAAALLALILLGQYALGYDINWVSSLLQRPSMDFIPIYPWFWVILLGLLTSPYLEKSDRLRNLPVPRGVKYLSVNSFWIYLLHQPLFFGLLRLAQLISE